MTRYTGGDTVKAGFYWNRGRWAAEIVPPEGGALPGGEDAQYIRVPWPVLLVLAPVMGGAFAVFLPFIGIAMLIGFLTGRLRKTERHTPPTADARVEVEHKRAA
jgi:hypothetical protein